VKRLKRACFTENNTWYAARKYHCCGADFERWTRLC